MGFLIEDSLNLIIITTTLTTEITHSPNSLTKMFMNRSMVDPHCRPTLKTMLALIWAGCLLAPLSGLAQTTAFTYQGRLNDGAALANGRSDVAFSLYATNTGGAIVAGPVTNPAVVVSNGLFTTPWILAMPSPGQIAGCNWP